jgi:hypothetical protein
MRPDFPNLKKSPHLFLSRLSSVYIIYTAIVFAFKFRMDATPSNHYKLFPTFCGPTSHLIPISSCSHEHVIPIIVFTKIIVKECWRISWGLLNTEQNKKGKSKHKECKYKEYKDNLIRDI